MKKLMAPFLLVSVFTACGQHPPGASKTETFNSKYVRLVKDTNVMMLIENVEVAFGDFYAKADSVLLDKPGRTVTVYGARNASFKGEEIKEKGNMLRYRKGDDKYDVE